MGKVSIDRLISLTSSFEKRAKAISSDRYWFLTVLAEESESTMQEHDAPTVRNPQAPIPADFSPSSEAFYREVQHHPIADTRLAAQIKYFCNGMPSFKMWESWAQTNQALLKPIEGLYWLRLKPGYAVAKISTDTKDYIDINAYLAID